MGAKDKRLPEPADSPEETITLVDALQQTLKTREMLTQMQGRMKSLDLQKSETRQGVMLRALAQEEEALREAVRVVAGELEIMSALFHTMKVVINGRVMTAENALKLFITLAQHQHGLKQLHGSFEIETCEIPILELRFQRAKSALQECLDAWTDELVALTVVFEGVKLPDTVKSLFQSVWVDRNKVVRLYVTWKKSERRWATADDIELRDPRLKRFVSDASALSVTADLPDGFEAAIDCTTDSEGQTTFRVNTRRPYVAGTHVGSTGDWATGL